MKAVRKKPNRQLHFSEEVISMHVKTDVKGGGVLLAD